MEDYFWILIISVVVVCYVAAWVAKVLSNSKKYTELKPKLDNLEKSIKDHELRVSKDRVEHELLVKKYEREIELRENQWNNEVQKDKEAIQKIADQKSIGFPWLANAYAEYFSFKDLQREKYLKNKKHPAHKAAETVREISKEKRILEKKFRVTRNIIKYYEALFPWLPEFVGEDVDDLIEQAITKKESQDENPGFLFRSNRVLFLGSPQPDDPHETRSNKKKSGGFRDRCTKKTSSPIGLKPPFSG